MWVLIVRLLLHFMLHMRLLLHTTTTAAAAAAAAAANAAAAALTLDLELLHANRVLHCGLCMLL